MNSQKRPAPRGDVDHPNARRINPPKNEEGEVVKNKPTLPK
jgi:hypothetical protein